jgi:hypothetical protein
MNSYNCPSENSGKSGNISKPVVIPSKKFPKFGLRKNVEEAEEAEDEELEFEFE